MADPLTPNVGLAAPTRGSNVGVWDVPVNADWTAIDGLFGGTTTIALGGAPITLTFPAGLTPTSTPGPTQAQNAILRLTGTPSINVVITLPLPGFYIIDNQTSTAPFTTQLRALQNGGEVIGVPPGTQLHVFNDGTNVRFVDMGRTADLLFMANRAGYPAWMSACTKLPFIYCDGSISNISQFPALGGILGSAFGGNGTTTFGVPDLRGRVPFAFDNTGTRITPANSGMNGTVLGSAGGVDGFALSVSQLPAHDHGGVTGAMNSNQSHTHGLTNGINAGNSTFPVNGGGASQVPSPTTGIVIAATNTDHTHNVAAQGGGAVQNNMPPALVAGAWFVKT